MTPYLFEQNSTKFITQGLGRLPDMTNAQVTEDLDGTFELSFSYPRSGHMYAEITPGRIVYAKTGIERTAEPFFIHKISRSINGKLNVNCRHISYLLSKCVCMPFTATGPTRTLAMIKSNTVGYKPFSFNTNTYVIGQTAWTRDEISAMSQNTTEFSISVPTTPRSLLFATGDDSFLTLFGGELYFYEYGVYYVKSRGKDKSSTIVITYGQADGIDYIADTADVVTSIVPYWHGRNDQNEDVTVRLTSPIIDSQYTSQFPNRLTVPMDFSKNFAAIPTEEELRAFAENYVASASFTSGIIPETLTIGNYKGSVQLGDTVTVWHDRIGLATTKRIIKTVFDPIAEKYTKMDLGAPKRRLADFLNTKIDNKIDKSYIDRGYNSVNPGYYYGEGGGGSLENIDEKYF